MPPSSARPAATPPPALPELTSDRMRLLGPLITPRALELARQRLINHRERISDMDVDETTKRIALILVREINPDTHLTHEEEGILRGLDRKTFGKMRAAREL